MALRLRAMLRFPGDHAYTKAHLSEYADGDLDSRGTSRVDEHVGICPRCRRMLETLMQTISALGSLRREPSPGLADGAIDRLRDDA